ncbi:MAG: ABC transporter permease subunit, partial [Candidatus Contubernalis sp.]|nr:ABC transporter permease subunit [Candidatus Contubernalis sp.]
QILDSHIHALRAVPGIGWLPLAMVWFGIGTKTTVFLIALAAFFPVYLNSTEGALKINPLWKRAALMMGAGRWALLRTVILPAALPSVANGLRIGLGLSWAYLVLGELTGVPDGLGALIMDARMMGHVEIIIVGMIAIAVLGRISDRLLILFLHIITGRRGIV